MIAKHYMELFTNGTNEEDDSWHYRGGKRQRGNCS